MGVHNCQELGPNLRKIINRLLANDELVNLLYYEDENPLAKSALTNDIKQKEVFGKLLRAIPRVGVKDTAKSVVLVYV